MENSTKTLTWSLGALILILVGVAYHDATEITGCPKVVADYCEPLKETEQNYSVCLQKTFWEMCPSEYEKLKKEEKKLPTEQTRPVEDKPQPVFK